MNIFKVTKWTAAHVAWLTMAFSPVALGAEAEKLSKQKLTQYIQEFGLNKKTTLGEFWEKSKAYYPGYAYKEIETFIQQNKNLEMPEVIISAVKGTDGGEVPTLQLSSNGRVQSIQIFGEKQKWAKFNNTTLTLADMNRPEDIFKRVRANDIRIERDAEILQKKYQASNALRLKNQTAQQKDLARFEGLPRMNAAVWKSLTPLQRASFIVNMRLLYLDAQKVLESTQASGFHREQRPSSVENLIRSLIGSEAYAIDTKKAGTNNIVCIVAGYVGSRKSLADKCDVDNAITQYSNKNASVVSEVTAANAICTSLGENKIACNPVIYGYPKGNVACVPKNDLDFQKATHFKGVCDVKTSLNNTKVPEFNAADVTYLKIMPLEKRLEVIEKDQAANSFALTKEFLDGVLKHTDKLNGDKTTFSKSFLNETWDQGLDDELVRIQETFETEIKEATGKCRPNAEENSRPEQKGACDQLHRRWLFTEKSLASIRKNACVPPSVYDGKTLKLEKGALVCKCPSSNQGISLPLGPESAKCAGDIPSITITGVREPKEKNSCPTGTTKIEGNESQCSCDSNKEKSISKSEPPEKVEELCEKSNAGMWILGGIGVLALLALFHRNKKPQPVPPSNPPPLCDGNKKLAGGACVCSVACPVNSTQNPISCGCEANPPVIPPQMCPAPKIGTPPSCECPVSNSCATGQQIYNQVTCQCDSVPQPVTCPNGLKAPGNSLSQCAKCTDGSYAPTGGCPVTNEGGKGNNCPSGKCSGGVPTAH